MRNFFTCSRCILFIAAVFFCENEFCNAQDVWVGGSTTTSNWTDGTNWQGGSAPNPLDDLQFQGSTRTTNNNDFVASFNSITFNSGAAAFNLGGNTVGLSNGVTNNSTNLQTLSFNVINIPPFQGIVLNQSQTFNAASGDLLITANVESGISNLTLTITGAHNTSVTGVLQNSPLNGATLALVKNGAGMLTLSGSNTYTGGTTINSGTLVANNFLALGFGSVNLHDGTLETLDNAPREFRVVPDYSQDFGTLRIQIGGLSPSTNTDLLNVFGTATLSTGNFSTLFLHRIFNFSPLPGNMVQIITAGNPITTTFNNVTNDFPGLIQPNVIYNTNDVVVDFELSNTFLSQALTRNQRSVAENIDNSVGDPRADALIAFVGNDAPGNLPHDYDLIAPEELASIYEISFSQALAQNDNLIRRMDDIRAGVNGFCAMGFSLPVSSPMYSKDSDGKTATDKVVAPVPCPENHWGAFVTGSGNFAQIANDDPNAPGYDVSSSSVTIGADYRFGNHFAVGLDTGYSAGRAELVDNGHVEMDGGRVGGYATAYGKGLFGSKFYIDVAGNGGWNSYDTRRIGLQDLPVTGSTDGSEWNALLSYGSDWTFGCLNIGTWSTLQYTDVQFNGFTERGSVAPLELQEQNEDSFRATTGIHLSVEQKFGHCGIVRPEIRAAWQHEYQDRAYPIDARFASGAGNVFTVWGPTIGRDAALIGGGLNVQWNSWVSTYVYYDGLLGRSNYDNHAVSGGFSFRF